MIEPYLCGNIPQAGDVVETPTGHILLVMEITQQHHTPDEREWHLSCQTVGGMTQECCPDNLTLITRPQQYGEKKGQPGMTVAELIARLQKVPQDAEVVMTSYQEPLHGVVDDSKKVHLYSDDERAPYDG